jgi:inorganic pyrophosphatase
MAVWRSMANSTSTDFIGKIVSIQIDRPLGSRHPQHGFLYMINYGCVPGTTAADGEEQDAYVLGVFEPLEQFEGRCIAVVHRLDDDDDKLVLVPDGVQYSDEQILALTEFQERFFKAVVIRSWQEATL